MERRFLMDKLLTDEEDSAKNQSSKGMCQSCGHYTTLSVSLGKRLCGACKEKQSKEIKKDFF